MRPSFLAALEAARAQGRPALAPYVTAGDGGLDDTLAVLHALEGEGAACVELGVPFCDPVADGPALQAAAHRALDAGARLSNVLELVRGFREAGGDLAIVLFSYANPLLRGGLEATLSHAADCGVDGLIVPDAPHDLAPEFAGAARQAGIASIPFVAPTTSPDRLAEAGRAAEGFLYAIGRTGVTGAATRLGDETLNFLERVRASTSAPLAVGFGLRTAADVSRLAGLADLAVVGTALVQHLHERREAGASTDQVATAAATFLRSLRDPVTTR